MQEFRQAIRSIIQAPAFAITALVTIALGIGANTAVYALVRAVLLEPLPFRQPNALVQVWETHPQLHNLQVAVPDYLDWKKSLKGMDLAAYTFQAIDKATLLGHGEATAVQGTNASAELFPLLGIEPLLGRMYGPKEEQGKEAVVLIGEQLWRRKFSARADVIGQPFRLGNASFTITGVLRRENAFPVWADFWMPLSLVDPALHSTRKYHPLEVIGRLKEGVSFSQAEMGVEQTARQLSADNPATNDKIGAFAVPLMETVTGEVRPALLAAWMAVGLVLMIACANLAHLMLGRALNRRREIAIKLALGASRLAVCRAFLIEATVLSLAGGLLGIVVAVLALPLIRELAQGQIPRFDGAALNVRVLLFGLLASLLTASLFALPSYLQVFRAELNENISSGSARGYSASGYGLLSEAMLSAEVALSLAVLLAAVMLVRSFALTLQTEPGFERKGVLAAHAHLVEGDWPKSYSLFRNRVAPELETVAGVQAVAAVNAIPMSLGKTEHSRYATRFGIAGTSFAPGQFPTAQLRWSTSNYFRVLGVPLLRGRFLTEEDHNQPRYLVNEAFARRFFPNGNAAGKKILMDVVSAHPQPVEIVGVVGDVREFELTAAPEPTLYSVDVSPEMDVVVKAAGSNAASSIAAIMRRVNPGEAIGPVRTLDSYVADSVARQRFILVLIASFAGLAVGLCAVGIYGVFSYAVSRRMREFGIRSAIGARRENLLGQVLGECLVVVIPGLLIGMAISFGCSRFIQSLLFQVSAMDPGSYGLAAVLMVGLCLAAVGIPAFKAARVDPAVVLRGE